MCSSSLSSSLFVCVSLSSSTTLVSFLSLDSIISAVRGFPSKRLLLITEYSQCVNPQNLRGHCVPIRLCDFAVNIARQSAQNPEARAFLNRSQCGHDGYTTYVCCPSQTTQLQPQPAQYRPQPTQLRPQQTQYQQQTQSSQRNLIAVGLTKSLLPRPGVCGVDLEDRIFGGTKTSVTEFPWLALLKYSKRELHLHNRAII